MRWLLFFIFYVVTEVHSHSDQINKCKIALLTVVIGDEYSKVVEFGTWSKKIYCEKHGYDLIIATENINEVNAPKSQFYRHPAWTKISLAAKHLSNYDYVFFCDADTIIMNPNITVESIIESTSSDIDLLICSRDFTKNPFYKLNSGVWILKNSDKSHAFLQHVWEVGENEKFALRSNWEQDAIITVLAIDWNSRREFPLNIHFLPSQVMNSKAGQGGYQSGDFIVHFCQIHGRELVQIFREFIDLYYEKNGRKPEFQPIASQDGIRLE